MLDHLMPCATYESGQYEFNVCKL